MRIVSFIRSQKKRFDQVKKDRVLSKTACLQMEVASLKKDKEKRDVLRSLEKEKSELKKEKRNDVLRNIRNVMGQAKGLSDSFRQSQKDKLDHPMFKKKGKTVFER